MSCSPNVRASSGVKIDSHFPTPSLMNARQARKSRFTPMEISSVGTPSLYVTWVKAGADRSKHGLSKAEGSMIYVLGAMSDGTTNAPASTSSCRVMSDNCRNSMFCLMMPTL